MEPSDIQPQPSPRSVAEIAAQIKRSAGNMGDRSPVIPDSLRGRPVQTEPLKEPIYLKTSTLAGGTSS